MIEIMIFLTTSLKSYTSSMFYDYQDFRQVVNSR